MISEREIEIIERAVKVSAYSDDDALLILRGLIIEKNEELNHVYDMVEEGDFKIELLEAENKFLRGKLAEFEGIGENNDPDQ